MRSHLSAAGAALVLLTTAGLAQAHVSISSGPATANKSQKITFSVGHGCEDVDTFRIRVNIPTGVTSVRALYSDFGKPSVEKDVAGVVTAVVWQKRVADLQTEDIGYYELTIRARIPDAAFSAITFVVDQTCRNAAGDETTVSWNEPPGGSGNEAPRLTVVPSRIPGWNQYTVAATTTVPAADVPVYFGDALIVWRGNAAYSSNANTAAMIAGTAGVTPLTGDLLPGDVVWVKY
jgi:hypothetical protein